MFTKTGMDAFVWKEIKKCRSVGHGIWECSPGHGWMHLAERKKKKQVRQRWDSGMLSRTWIDAPVWKEIKKCRSVGDGIWECSPGHGWMHLSEKKFKKTGPLAMVFRNAHWDVDGCISLERNQKMPVCR